MPITCCTISLSPTSSSPHYSTPNSLTRKPTRRVSKVALCGEAREAGVPRMVPTRVGLILTRLGERGNSDSRKGKRGAAGALEDDGTSPLGRDRLLNGGNGTTACGMKVVRPPTHQGLAGLLNEGNTRPNSEDGDGVQQQQQPTFKGLGQQQPQPMQPVVPQQQPPPPGHPPGVPIDAQGSR